MSLAFAIAILAQPQPDYVKLTYYKVDKLEQGFDKLIETVERLQANQHQLESQVRVFESRQNDIRQDLTEAESEIKALRESSAQDAIAVAGGTGGTTAVVIIINAMLRNRIQRKKEED